MREDAAFDRSTLGAVRRIVNYSQFQTQPIRQVLQFLLEDVSVGGVAAAPIAQDQRPGRGGMTLAAVLFPQAGHGIHR